MHQHKTIKEFVTSVHKVLKICLSVGASVKLKHSTFAAVQALHKGALGELFGLQNSLFL